MDCLSAKATCDVLLEICMHTGIPKILCSDQGTSFTSQEFEERLETHLRFSTSVIQYKTAQYKDGFDINATPYNLHKPC